MTTLICKECGKEAEVFETKLEDGIDARAICDCTGVTKPEDEPDSPEDAADPDLGREDGEEADAEATPSDTAEQTPAEETSAEDPVTVETTT